MWKRLLFWEYSRVSWQYNVLCGVILAFIFATPRAWFRDQPRIPTANSIALLPSEKQSSIFFINPELLSGVPESERTERATRIIRVRMNNTRLLVTRVEPVLDSEGELQGYMAFARS
jgi:acyl-coenzyme A synthetase/AMP-(fatty) acid ligase